VSGGSGGSIDHLHLELGDVVASSILPPDYPSLSAYSVKIIGGTGRDAKIAGAGGAITGSFISTHALAGGAYIAAGSAGLSSVFGARAGGSLVGNVFAFTGNLGGDLDLHAGIGGATLARATAGRGGAIVANTISMQGAQNVRVVAGDAGVSSGFAATGGAIVGLTLENHGVVRDVLVQAGGGTYLEAGFGTAGAGGSIVGSTYSNLGGAGNITVSAGGGGTHAGEYAKSRGDGGAGGALIGFTFNNAAPHLAAGFAGANGGSVSIDPSDNGIFPSGNGGSGGRTTGFTLRDSAGPGTVTFVGGGYGSDGMGRAGHGGAGGAVLNTRLDTLGVVSLVAGPGAEVANYGVRSVGGAGGNVESVTGRVGELTIIAGNSNSAYRGQDGGSVRHVVLSEVSGFVRLIEAGSAGGEVIRGRGGSISGIVVPGDIGDFHSAFGLGNDGLTGMGGLVAGQGGTANKAGSVSFVTANRIAAIFAAPASDGSMVVDSIHAVRAHEIGADTGLPGATSVPGLRGYGDFTFDAQGRFIDGPVIVRRDGFTAQSLSVLPLYLVLEP
jgi:hypothetical protein